MKETIQNLIKELLRRLHDKYTGKVEINFLRGKAINFKKTEVYEIDK